MQVKHIRDILRGAVVLFAGLCWTSLATAQQTYVIQDQDNSATIRQFRERLHSVRNRVEALEQENAQLRNEAGSHKASHELEVASYEKLVHGKIGGRKCDKTTSCGCSDCHSGGIFLNYENVIVQPYFGHNSAYQIEDVPDSSSMAVVPFDWDLNFTPRFELGYLSTCSGKGLRARYWQFDEQARDSAVDPGSGSLELGIHDDPDLEVSTSDTESVEVSHMLELHVMDFEAIYHRRRGGCRDVTMAAGIRVVDMRQEYVGNILEESGDFDQGMVSIHTFRGVGPTVAAEWIWPTCRPGLSWFANARGSLLFGESDLRQWENDDAANQIFEQSDDRWEKSDMDDILLVGDFQTGLEWTRALCHRTLYVRGALEYQYWPDAGSGSYMNGEDNDGTGHDPRDVDMGFLGCAVSTGLMY